MSDMTVNTAAYPRMSGGEGKLCELQAGKKQVFIPCRCRCSEADLSGDMDTGIERSQSKLVKFHEQSCEHQKRISKLRDEWYEKELLYSPTMVVSVSASDSGLGISPCDDEPKRLSASTSGPAKSTNDNHTVANGHYRVEFDEDLLIANIQNEAEVTQHMVDMMASTKTMRKRKEQYSDLTYRRRSRRAKQTLSSYIPKAPGDSTWGNIFDEMMDRLRGRSRSPGGAERYTHQQFDDHFYDSDSSSHSSRYDDDNTDYMPDIEPYQQSCDFHQQYAASHQSQLTESADRSDSVDLVTSASYDYERYEILQPPGSDASGSSHVDPSQEWVTRDEVYELNSPREEAPDDVVQPLNAYSCFSGPIGDRSSSSSPSQMSNSETSHDRNGFILDPKYSAMTSFTGLDQTPEKKVKSAVETNNNSDVLYWEENWASEHHAESSTPGSNCEGCTDCAHSHGSFKPTFCYKNQNCSTLASTDSLHRDTVAASGCNGSIRQQSKGGCMIDTELRDPADSDIMLRSISFRRPDLASFILPMSPLRKTESNSHVWVERDTDQTEQVVVITANHSKPRLSRWSKFKRLFSSSSSRTAA